jgi:hypothetical protein
MLVRYFLALLIALGGCFLTLPTPVSAQEAITVQGEIIDMACYMAEGKRGPEHKSCALMCAKQGVPMGVLTDKGEVYLLIEDHHNNSPYEALKKLAGSRAEVTGKKFVKPGVMSIQVSAAKGL